MIGHHLVLLAGLGGLVPCRAQTAAVPEQLASRGALASGDLAIQMIARGARATPGQE